MKNDLQAVTYSKTKATIRCIGPSNDYRTNKWHVYCECGNTFSPSTTMYSTQTFQCPKCTKEYFADYNATPPSIKIST